MIDVIRTRKKLFMVCGSLIVVLILFIYLVFRYEIKEIHVTGNEIVSEEEIVANYTGGPLGNNKLVVMAKDRLEAFDDIPFIRDYDITFEEGKMNIQVYEKALVASFYYMGQYVFFDKDGVILETASNSVAEIPCIEGVDFLNFSMNSKIQLKNDEQIKMILDIAELIKHYSLNAQTVKFDNNLEVTLCCDGVNVLLGKKEMYDQQIASVSEVLEQIKGKDIKGTIDMKNYTQGDKIILKQQ